MNIHRIATILLLQCLLVASPVVHAETQRATLVIPEALNILKVDNQNYTTNITDRLFSTGDKTVQLAPGPHRVIVEYEIIWDISTDEHERVWSEPFQVAFSVQAGRQYVVKVPSFTYLNKAKKYANKPVVEIIDRSSKQVVASKIYYQEDEVDTLTFYDPSAAVPSANPVAFQQAGPVTAANMPLRMLEYWWNQASEPQRKQFMQSVR